MSKSILNAIGATLFMCGMLVFGGGGYLIWQSTENTQAIQVAKRAIEETCVANLQTIFNIPPTAAAAQPGRPSASNRLARLQDNRIEIRIENVREPQKALGDATAALAACQSKKIRNFCLGPQCGEANAPQVTRMIMLLEPSV